MDLTPDEITLIERYREVRRPEARLLYAFFPIANEVVAGLNLDVDALVDAMTYGGSKAVTKEVSRQIYRPSKITVRSTGPTHGATIHSDGTIELADPE